jgi:hypothetical protein
MLATESSILEMVRSNLHNDHLNRMPVARLVFDRIEQTLENHVDALTQHLERLGGGSLGTSLKEAVSTLSGKAVGLYESLRGESASRMMRDSYAALSLAAVSYMMLYTTGLALQDRRTCALAIRHLGELTPIIAELSTAVPHVVTREIADEVETADASVAADADRALREAWSPGRIQLATT